MIRAAGRPPEARGLARDGVRLLVATGDGIAHARFGDLPRFLAAVLLAFAPIFLANLVFAQRFRDTASSTTAFAANLLGAMVGGMLEYLALITGYRALLLVVAGLYGLAFLTRPKVAAPVETAAGRTVEVPAAAPS